MAEVTETTTPDPNELVDVVNPVNGDRNRVSRAYLERWPDDYVLAEDYKPKASGAAKTATRTKPAAGKNAAAPKTPAVQAEEPKNPVDDPEQEHTE